MAGTLTVVTAAVQGGIAKYTLTWVSSSGGAVSANLFDLWPGEIVKAKFVPSGSVVPSDGYDVTLVDTNSCDLLNGVGLNLSSTTAFAATPAVYHDGAQQVDLVVADAGNAKGGTVTLWVR